MSDPELLRIYLDSNVLFSASFNERSKLLELWELSDVTPVTSRYAIGEVSRNIRVPAHHLRFEGLVKRGESVSDADVRFIPSHIELVAKDRPILAAAIAASVNYLVTGDRNHFGPHYDTNIAGVRIVGPADFLTKYKDRLGR